MLWLKYYSLIIFFGHAINIISLSIDVEVYYYTKPYRFGPRTHHNCNDSYFNCLWTQNPLSKRTCLNSNVSNEAINVAVVTFTAWRNQGICSLRPDITLVESPKEPTSNYDFNKFARYFDGVSTTSSSSDIPRRQFDIMHPDTFLQPLILHSRLIRAVSYVQIRCGFYNGSIYRDTVVRLLREQGVRVDGLAQCMHSPVGPEGIHLTLTKHMNDTHKRFYLAKRQAISRYMFHLAFENAVERDWVTEKPFDALLAGRQ